MINNLEALSMEAHPILGAIKLPNLIMKISNWVNLVAYYNKGLEVPSAPLISIWSCLA